MRLWIDGQCLQTASRLRGIGRYVTEFLRAIADNHPEVELSISFNASMPEKALQARDAVSTFIASRNIHVWHGATTGGEAVEGYTPERQLDELAIAHHVNCLSPDVALSASPFEGDISRVVPLLPVRECRVPVASIFYDAIPYRYQDRYLSSASVRAYYHRRLSAYSSFADNLCISEFSRSELESIHKGASAANIAAGVSRDFLEIVPNPRFDSNLYGDFILYVGGLDWRKNVDVIIRALGRLEKSSPVRNLKLVLAGNGQSLLVQELMMHWRREGLPADRFLYLGHVSDEQLVSLYRNARVLIQPSFMEGFGLTALEAICCGTPVVAARAGALPEVVGTEELLFDPSSPEDLARVLAQVLNDDRATRKLVEEARAHASQFTWKRSADVAVNSLAALVKCSEAPSISLLRKQMVPSLGNALVESGVAARTFASAEPISGRRRLLIDATATARLDHRTGIQRVVKKICASLADREETDGAERLFVYCDDESGWYAIDGRMLAKPDGQAGTNVVFGRDIFLALDSSWEFHDLHRRDLRACRLLGGEVMTALYDTVPIRLPAFCNPGMQTCFSEWFRMSLAYSTAFVCISRAVADELVAILEAIEFPRRMKIGYWHLGADIANEDASTVWSGESERGRTTFLMVGTLEPRKGHRVALDAFERLWADGVDVQLVIVGKIGWNVEWLADRIRSHREYDARLVWHAEANDAALAALYRNCDALISASFAEGFGLPLVEAGHFGKPIIASDIPVFREVGAGAASATFFEAGSAEALADAVQDFLAHRGNTARQTSRAIWQSWSDSAAQLEDVVLGDNWYKVHEPARQTDYAPSGNIGQTSMTRILDATERAHAIRLVEGPYPVDGGRAFKIVVAVTNHSQSVWSSEGKFGVKLAYHLCDKQGRNPRFESPRTSIPFVHIPGDTLYLAVVIPDEWKRKTAFADIGLLQEGSGWFDNTLRVKL